MQFNYCIYVVIKQFQNTTSHFTKPFFPDIFPKQPKLFTEQVLLVFFFKHYSNKKNELRKD